MQKIGPFFYIGNKLIYNACTIEEGREQWNKIDNPYSHEELYDASFLDGDYIYEPRGRVVFDRDRRLSIIYIDMCIYKPEVIEKIREAFSLDAYEIDFDDHYRCRNCLKEDLF